jgi:hypothetical protein
LDVPLPAITSIFKILFQTRHKGEELKMLKAIAEEIARYLSMSNLLTHYGLMVKIQKAKCCPNQELDGEDDEEGNYSIWCENCGWNDTMPQHYEIVIQGAHNVVC